MRLSWGWSAKRKRENVILCVCFSTFSGRQQLLPFQIASRSPTFSELRYPDTKILLAQTGLWEVASLPGRSSLTAISEPAPPSLSARMPPPNSASVSLDSFAISTPPQTKHRASTELLPCRPLHPHPTSHRRICRFPTTLTLSLRTIAPMTRMWISSALAPLCTIPSCPH